MRTKLDIYVFITIKKRLKIPKGGNQNAYIEEEQTTQWPKEKVTLTPLKAGGELRQGRVQDFKLGGGRT